MIPDAMRAHDATSTPTVSQNGSVASSRARSVNPLAVMVVAFHFPPLAAAGTHRTLNFVRQLAARGHRIGVVTTSSSVGFRRDNGLLARVPSDVPIGRAWHVDPFLLLARLRGQRDSAGAAAPNGALGSASTGDAEPMGFQRAIDWLTRLADVPDRYASWILPAFVRGIFLAGRLRPQVIYSTAPPASAHLAALLLADVLGLPLVADLRDPWAVNPFRSVPYSSLRELDDALEALVVKRARRVILNTPLAERDYVERYGDAQKFTTIQNGISPDLFELPRATPPVGNTVQLLHVGSIYGRRSPLPFVRALQQLRKTKPQLAARIEVTQIGPIEDGGALIAELAACGVADRFTLSPSVSHAEAFRASTAAHALLLLGVSGERPEVQVPAKLFEYLATGRPILALAKPGGAILATLERAGADYECADPDDVESIGRALESIVLRVDALAKAGGPSLGGASPYRYETLAIQLEEILDRAVGARDHA